MRKQIIKTLALVLVFAFLLSAAAPPKAAAVIPEGLLIAAAIALTMGTCVAITMIAADSAGMTGAIQVAAEKGLQDTAEFTEKLIRGFNEKRGLLFTQFLMMMVKGARITRDGALALGEEVSAWLTDFFDWAWSEDGGNLVASAVQTSTVYDPSTITNPEIDISGIGLIPIANDFNVYVSERSQYVVSSSNIGVAYKVPASSTTTVFNFYSTEAGTTYSIYDLISDRTTSYNITTYYTFSYGRVYAGGVAYKDKNNPVLYPYLSASSDYELREKIGYILFNPETTVTGDYDEPDTNVLQLPAEGAIDTNILNIPDQLVLPPVQGTATADSYLGAVRDAIYEGTGTLDYTDANDIAGTATLEMTGTATVDQVASGASQLEGSTEVAEGVGSPTLDNYSIDLRDFFPFCIPFDIYDMLNLMSGSRAAPQVHWEFYVPGPNGMETYNLDLDFSVLDPVASVLRTMELLAFGVALALATKKLLMGS